jgi:hypothetical protein
VQSQKGRLRAVELSRTNLSGLSAEEIERLAREHLDGMVSEIRAATQVVKTRTRPVNVVKRHPLAVAALAGAAAFMLARLLSTPGASTAPPGAEPVQRRVGRTLGATLLAGAGAAAGRALPAILRWWLTGRIV